MLYPIVQHHFESFLSVAAAADSPGQGVPPWAAGDIRHVLYRPLRPTPDGRTLLVLTPLEFLAALARLIPPPGVHRHRYHGVLAPNARLRGRITALATASTPDTPPRGRPGDDAPATPAQSVARSRWARLLARSSRPSRSAAPTAVPGCASSPS